MRANRLRLWAEHLERDEKDVAGSTAAIVDELWRPIATEQLHRIEQGEPLTHRLVRLPGVSRRRRRLLKPLQSHLYDVEATSPGTTHAARAEPLRGGSSFFRAAPECSRGVSEQAGAYQDSNAH